jgi:outer membrane protein TolC
MKRWGIVFLFVSSAAQGLTLDEAIQSSVQDSRYVKAQEMSADIASSDRWRRFLIKEPSFQYLNADDHTQESFGVSIATSFPGKAFAFMEMDRAKARNEKAEISAKRQDLAKLIAGAYLDCASGLALLEIQKIALSDFETMFRSLSAMYESGHASQAERIGTDLQIRQTRSDLRSATDKTDVACKKWHSLVGDDKSMPDKIPGDLAGETIHLLGDASSDRTRGEAALKMANVADDLRWWSQAPDLTWSVSRNHYDFLPGSPSGKEYTYNYGVSVTIPIFFLFDESVEAKRARAQATFDKHNAEVAVLNAKSDEEDASREFRRDKTRLEELKEKDLALAEALVETTFAAYKTGKLGFAELLLSRKTLSDLRTQEVQLKVAAVQARLKCLTKCE